MTGRERQKSKVRQNAFKRGILAEHLAAIMLMLKGFRIVARRYKTKSGEIDLIARRGRLVLIVEVKARSTIAAAMEAVTPQGINRIEAAADHWLARQPDYADLSLRFDIVAVRPWRWPHHIAAASMFAG